VNANATDDLVVLELARPRRSPYVAARRRYRVVRWACALLALVAAAYVVWISAGPDGLASAAQD
jgi:hypothetical protein